MPHLIWLVTSNNFSSKFFCHLLCMTCHIFNLTLITTCLLNYSYFMANIHSSIYAIFSLLLYLGYNLICVLFFFRKFGWDPKDGEGDLVVGLRETLLVSLVKLGHDKTINEGVKRFHILKHDHNSSVLSPQTRQV